MRQQVGGSIVVAADHRQQLNAQVGAILGLQAGFHASRVDGHGNRLGQHELLARIPVNLTDTFCRGLARIPVNLTDTFCGGLARIPAEALQEPLILIRGVRGTCRARGAAP